MARTLAAPPAAPPPKADAAPCTSGCPAPTLELRDACIEAAREMICRHGIENLSLRDVARRLGVSHQAPYRHYPSRDHLLAEVVRRCFQQFAAHLDAREPCDDPRRDLDSLGRRYLRYAQQHPLEYRLMFGTPWPASAADPELTRDALHAFDVLRQVLRRMHGDAPAARERAELDALFVWSSLHGLAGVLGGTCIDRLDLQPGVREGALQHIVDAVGRGIGEPAGTG
jgi:AcrR family transcriptional regulator